MIIVKIFLLSSFFFSVASTLGASDLFEPNDSFNNATLVTQGTYDLSIASDDDWFKMELTTGKLDLIMTPSSNVDVNMILHNEDRLVVASNFTSSQESISYDVLVSGVYYIKVESTSSASTSYTLSVDYDTAIDDSYEPNNSFNSAISIDKGSYSLNALDDDWFKVELNTGTMDLKMYPDNNIDLNMAVYNSDQNVVAANWTSEEETISYDVVIPGIYYINVKSASQGVTTSYTLDMNYTSQIVWTKTLDFGPIRDMSVSLFDIDKDGKKEIFIGTSKGLDSELNEIRPAGFVCLEDDGSLKWSTTFPAMDSADIQTGKEYNTTSVSATPFFSDLDDDGEIDILVGVGADTFGEAGSKVVGQPGDKGGLYALNNDGSVKWFHESLDTIGGEENVGDGRPDGVYGSAIVYDLDKDGAKEVIYNGWDQYVWILNAKNGEEKLKTHLLDTIWSTPKIADINKDGNVEILVTADITENTDAGTTTGGIFHVLSSDGSQNIDGFNEFVGNSAYTTLKGKTDEQALWSSPVTADIDNDGYLEIIYGTGNYFHDERGKYIKVWNHDGSLKYQLSTIGRTFATPMVADIDADGNLEILATTLDGYLFCWEGATGSQKFATETISYKALAVDPIFSSPIALDTDNDGKLEIMYAQGTQVIIVNHLGEQISSTNDREMVFELFKGSIAVKDIDNDGYLDVISGGNTSDKTQAVVYRWDFKNKTLVQDDYLIGRDQLVQSNKLVEDFVKRFYVKVLSRTAEAGGLIYWTDRLVTAVNAGSDVARGFIFSQEFTNLDVQNEEFLTILYSAFFNREPDEGGYSMWLEALENGTSRYDILDGFLYSPEFGNLCRTYDILPVK